jgi:organic hydroperoxide reductase OsmC/OhrA
MATRQTRFDVSVLRRGPGDALLSSGERPILPGGPPPEFGGSPAVWSPEHLLVSSAALCYLTTLEWFVRKSGLDLRDFQCRAEGTVEKSPRGLVFTSVHLEVTATSAEGEGPRLRELMQEAKSSCLVASSLACPVELTAEVVEESAARAS